MPAKFELIDVDGVEVKITNPDKIFFPNEGITHAPKEAALKNPSAKRVPQRRRGS